MKIAVIYGSPRNGSTNKAVSLFKERMQQCGNVEFREFFLPKDMPEFCRGCFTCILNDEHKCPHFRFTEPVVSALLEADGFIFSSPVYVMAESAGMKALLDHLAWLFLVHRPKPEMFAKKAVILSTTAGAGTRRCIAMIRESLLYWGVNRIYGYGFILHSASWKGIEEKRREKTENKIQAKAVKFYREVASGKRRRPYLKQWFMFNAVRMFIKKDKNTSVDRKYWEKNGWLGKNSPFKQPTGQR
ncbi:MAG TPA: flavodoxin family protein [Clostridia bacterium]|nr:flavodoxin family protein [Clostridia bacterium]